MISRHWLILLHGLLLCLPTAAISAEPFTLHERSRSVTDDGRVVVQRETVEWEPERSALIICDMWDLHTSHNATLRTGELAPRIDALAKEIRRRGGTVIHCPSGCMEFYQDHPARQAAQAAPAAGNAPEEIGAWCYAIPSEEGVAYPLDQTDGGGDDAPADQKQWAEHLTSIGRKTQGPWIKQHPDIAIEAGDYLTDRGGEVWNILEDNNINNVVVAGVHTNMCVLGRPFGLRRLAENGKHVVLARDLTDTMYNPRRRPYVSHFTGTDLIIAYIEQTVCPTVSSDEIVGGAPFRFKNDKRARLAIVCSEPEYNTAESLQAFAKRHLGHHFSVSYIWEDPKDENRLAGLAQLKNADIMLLSVRRRALPSKQLHAIREFLTSGKPIVGIRTASHAFSLRGKEPPEGRATWELFDAEIFGGNYHNHYGNGETTTVAVADSAADHPVLQHVKIEEWTSPASLYRVTPLTETATPLLTGSIPDHPAEPIAWTNRPFVDALAFYDQQGQKQISPRHLPEIHQARAFYTSLGHVEDFQNESFRRLLFNGLFWALDREIPDEMPDAMAEARLDELNNASTDEFTVPEDLVWEPVLAEPRIGQPVYLNFDERGRLWVMEYLQYPYPAGLKMLSKDKFWRAVYDRVPEPPPHGVRGADRISIHEDIDGDGRFDSHKVFLEGLNIASSFARGRGGVFVLNPPYLLFYPDKDHNDIPDGDPEVLLEGFGLEDTHSVANSLRFGPDGWLYGCQGSTVSGSVKRYGSDEEPVATMGQLVWRYHPERRVYEVFAEGGGNAFGLEIDAVGNVYSGHNGGNTHGFHYIPGGYYRKGFEKHGPLSNPYTFGFYEPMTHGELPRFTHDFVILEGEGLPEAYRGKLFAIDPLQQRITLAEITPDGSSFKTRDLSQVVQAGEGSLFRPVEITTGPDGAIYVADFHEEEISHGSHFEGRISKETGRVWRLRAADGEPLAPFDLSKKTSEELVALLDHSHRWQRQTALRLLSDRQDASVVPALREAVLASSENSRIAHPLDYLWALYGLDGLDDETILALFDHANPLVRSWTVRLACDGGTVSPAVTEAIVALAAREADARVQVQLACSARKLPTEDCLAIVRSLLSAEVDADDPFLPLAIWWAVEAQCESSPGAVVGLFADEAIQAAPLTREFLLERVMRRLASGSRSHMAHCATLLNACGKEGLRGPLLAGFEAALRGRDSVSLPETLVAALAKLGDLPLTLRLRQGDPEAYETAIERIGEAQRPEAERIELATLLGQSARAEARGALLELFKTGKTESLRRAALGSLAVYPDDAIAGELIEALPEREAAEQIAILSVLVSRPNWSAKLLDAIAAGGIDRGIVPIDLAERIPLHADSSLTSQATTLWPDLATTSESASRDPESLEELIAAEAGDPYTGKRLFAVHCGRCHVLFGEGGDVGPDLTSDPRSDLSRLIGAIATPSVEIREGYEGYTAVTSDGRVISGLLSDQDEHVVILREADGRDVVLPRSDIEELVRQPKSLMPDGLLKALSDQDVRDLFAYLRSSQPLNE